MDGFFLSFLGRWSYLGLFLVLLAAGLGVPLPEDIPLIAAGYLVHKGQADLHGMIATGLFGVLLGDSILFLAGRRYGMQIVEHRWFRRIAKPWLLDKARNMYAAHGAKIIFAARFMPGLRSVMFMTAGTFRVPFWKFFLIDGFAALISVPVWVWLASRFSGTIEELLGEARLASYLIGGALLAALAAWGLWEYQHNLRRRNGIRQAAEAAERAAVAPTATAGAPSAAAPAGAPDTARSGGGPATGDVPRRSPARTKAAEPV